MTNYFITALLYDDFYVTSALFSFQNGALGAIEATTAGFPGTYKRIELIGTKGSIVLEENYLHTWEFAEASEDDDRIKAQYLRKYEHRKNP